MDTAELATDALKREAIVCVVRVPTSSEVEMDSKCSQCGEEMNPANRMLGPVCLSCCRANHKAVAEGKATAAQANANVAYLGRKRSY